MINKILQKSLILFACFQFTFVFAQQEMSLFFLDKVIQSSNTNPSTFPKNNFVFSVPALSFVFNGAFTGFTYGHLFKYSGDSIDINKNTLDIYNKRLKKTNYIFTDLNTDWLNFGFRINPWKMHFGFNITEKANFRLKYNKDFFGFMMFGNGYFADKEAELNFAIETIHYRELGFTTGYTEPGKYSFGIKVKYLEGLGNFSTRKSDMKFRTDTSGVAYSVTGTTDYQINTSGYIQILQNQEGKDSITSLTDLNNFPDYIANFSNPGFGVDLGGSYNFRLPNFNKNFIASASILDLGFIKWNTHPTNLHNNGSYTFRGLDLYNMVDTSEEFSLQSVYDTLNERFLFKKSYDSYKTSLIAKTYLSVQMELDSFSHVGVMLYGEFFEGLKPAVTLAYDRSFGHWKQNSVVVTYGYKNRSFFNLGLGWAFKTGPLQIFACGDNLSAFFIPKKTKSFNLRVGANIILGKSKLFYPSKDEVKVP